MSAYVSFENGADPVVSVHILFIANINTIYATHNMLMLTQIPYYNYIIIACPFFFEHFRHIRNNIDKHKHWARLFVKITEPTTYAHTQFLFSVAFVDGVSSSSSFEYIKAVILR